MSYQIVFTKTAQRHFDEWKKYGTQKEKDKILSLLEEISENPRQGTGKVEQLKGNRSGQWSRRINSKDRIIYTIHDNIIEVLILSMKGHYDDK
ncbi:MAG: Txe/YoeB family addiction module toxin [Bacteroidales bacterium]|nr:Txe/YoeB family addiction module toxin [Bacteroidales bacterium]